MRGLAASRMRTLSVLLREVNRRDTPSLMDKVLPPRKEEEQSKTEKSRGMCGMCGGGSSSPRSPVGGKAAEDDGAEEEPEPPTREKLEALFKEIDAKNPPETGKLTRDQIKQALTTMMGADVPEEELNLLPYSERRTLETTLQKTLEVVEKMDPDR